MQLGFVMPDAPLISADVEETEIDFRLLTLSASFILYDRILTTGAMLVNATPLPVRSLVILGGFNPKHSRIAAIRHSASPVVPRVEASWNGWLKPGLSRPSPSSSCASGSVDTRAKRGHDVGGFKGAVDHGPANPSE
jgi:hypothetical protein